MKLTREEAEDMTKERIKAISFTEKLELVKNDIDADNERFAIAFWVDLCAEWKDKDKLLDTIFDLTSYGKRGEVDKYFNELIWNDWEKYKWELNYYQYNQN